jgi:acyl carrier protein
MSTPASASAPDRRERIRHFIITEILESPDEPLADDAQLISDGVMNSLSTLKLVSFIEESFGVELAAHEISVEYLDSIDQIVAFLDEKLGN